MVGLSISQWLPRPFAIWVFCLGWQFIIFYGIGIFEQLINIARLVEMWVFVRVCLSAYVRVSFNQVALQSSRITYTFPFTISCIVH